ncbi:MAG: hypothetical protein H7Y38_03040 [Armatimonadetes bacterium]|nr:hypothetical protein [Armatimonadota bacterium]
MTSTKISANRGITTTLCAGAILAAIATGSVAVPANAALLLQVGGSVTGPRLAQTYIIKTKMISLQPGRFTLVLNGAVIGDYDSDGQQNITAFVKPGKNTGEIRYQRDPDARRFGSSVITVGYGKKWNTIANAEISKASQSGTKRFSFVAR